MAVGANPYTRPKPKPATKKSYTVVAKDGTWIDGTHYAFGKTIDLPEADTKYTLRDKLRPQGSVVLTKDFVAEDYADEILGEGEE